PASIQGLESLRRQVGAPIFQHCTTHIRFIFTAHQEDDTSCIIEHSVTKRDPISFEFFHPVCHYQQFCRVKLRCVWEQRSCMAVWAKTQQDQIESREFARS